MFVPLVRFRFHILLVLTAAVASTTCLSAQPEKKPSTKVSFDIRPVPSWVKPIDPGSDVGVSADHAGMVYLLAERQENLQQNAFYYREVRKIISEKGIESGAAIAARFNPTARLFSSRIDPYICGDPCADRPRGSDLDPYVSFSKRVKATFRH